MSSPPPLAQRFHISKGSSTASLQSQDWTPLSSLVSVIPKSSAWQVILRAVVGVDHSILSTGSAAKSELAVAFVASSTSKVTRVVIASVRSTGHPLAKRCFRFHIAHSPQVLGAGATRKRKIQ
eukprot:1535156-Rhodomonas_salina.2